MTFKRWRCWSSKNTNDNPLVNRHHNALGGYYSATDPTAFPGLLTELTNKLLTANRSSEAAQQIIRNIHEWGNQLYDTQKELLLAAIAAKSSFAFNMIFWITKATEILAVLSRAEACPPHIQDDLKKDANELISVFAWLPDDADSIAQIAHYQLHERLFECTTSLHAHQCFNVAETAADLLVSWTFRAGRYQNGWGTLEHALYCVAVLNMKPELQTATSLVQLEATMAKYPVSQELRDRTARDIRSKAQSPFEDHHLLGIEHAMSWEDPKKLSEILMAIANLLSPNIADEPIRSKHFFKPINYPNR